MTEVHNTGEGFAFVTLERKEDAETATQEMDGTELNGQQIQVKEARPENNSCGGGCGRGGDSYSLL